MHLNPIIPLGFIIGLVLCTFAFVYIIASKAIRSTERKTDILRIYAERGEEPPQSVIDALSASDSGNGFKWPMKPETRARHFSEFASCCVFALGAAGIAWWRAAAPGQGSQAFVILAAIVAMIFAAGAVSHLVTALHIRDGQ